MKDPIVAKYLIETPHPLEFAAEMIAGEQSSGTFIAVPGETEELKARARARVEAFDGPLLMTDVDATARIAAHALRLADAVRP